MRYFLLTLISLFLVNPTIFADEELTCPQATGNSAPQLIFNDNNDDESSTEYFPNQILGYLNTTGSSVDLQEAIANSVNENSPLLWLKSSILEADFTGDMIPDILVEYTVSYGGGFNTTFSLYSCNEGEFVHLDDWFTDGWMNGEDESPISIAYAVDLNNNQIRDIVIRIDTIEGMKYHEKIHILEWNGTELISIFNLGPSYGSYRDISIINLDDTPATLELNIGYFYAYEQETAMAFIEYSYTRPIAMLYQWDGTFDFMCEYFDDEPKLNFPILHKAETLRACGFYDQAEIYYRQLWNHQINTWETNGFFWDFSPDFTYPENVEDRTAYAQEFETAYYRAFAGYRLTQISLLNDEGWRAESYVNQLHDAYGKGQHGYAYVAMATALWENYKETENLEEACIAAENAFNLAYGNGDNPRIDYYEETYGDGTAYQFGFYFANGRHYAANPDNVFAVPEDIDGMVSTPICL